MSGTYDDEHDGVAPRRRHQEGEVERRHEAFVPDPYRVVYPVDHHTSQRHALAKFEAETLIEVGGQLTRRMVRRGLDLEDEIRDRVHDEGQYALMAAAVTTFMADAIEIRHRYMNPGEPWRRS